MACLPGDRLEPAPPFLFCALDYSGPFIVIERRSEVKHYGVLFTCLGYIKCSSRDCQFIGQFFLYPCIETFHESERCCETTEVRPRDKFHWCTK